MEASVGSFVLFAFGAYFGLTGRPSDRLWYAVSVAVIFLFLALFWQSARNWIGAINIAFGKFAAIHFAATSLGFIVGRIIRGFFGGRTVF